MRLAFLDCARSRAQRVGDITFQPCKLAGLQARSCSRTMKLRGQLLQKSRFMTNGNAKMAAAELTAMWKSRAARTVATIKNRVYPHPTDLPGVCEATHHFVSIFGCVVQALAIENVLRCYSSLKPSWIVIL